MSLIVTKYKGCVLLKIPDLEWGETCIVVKHITSISYDESNKNTIVRMVNGKTYSVTTSTDILYCKILDSL
jgi:hypothetical protein